MVSTILDLASAVVLMLLLTAMKQPPHRVLAYAWNPAVLISFAMSGHFDSLAIVTFLAALFLLVTNRPALSMAALALSFLSKFFPVLLLPTFLKRVRLAYVGFFAFVVFAFYLPFLGAEYGPVYLWLAYCFWSAHRPKIFQEPLMTAAS
jgi:alpha-1,6-mannosyltransferase